MIEKSSLNKGIKTELIQDTYRAMQDIKGNMIFNKVKMVNLTFVKFEGLNKVYTFNNPSDKRLAAGTKVLVDTCRGEMDAYVVSSIKVQKKYVKEIQLALVGRKDLKLKNILGVYIDEVLYRLGE